MDLEIEIDFTETPLDTFRGWKLFWSLRKKCKKTILQKPDSFGSVTSLALPTEHDAKLEGQVKTMGYPIESEI